MIPSCKRPSKGGDGLEIRRKPVGKDGWIVEWCDCYGCRASRWITHEVALGRLSESQRDAVESLVIHLKSPPVIHPCDTMSLSEARERARARR